MILEEFEVEQNEESDTLSDHQKRFGGIARLYGVDGLQRLMNAHICIIGLGGVGSWSAEALVRSGVGEITMIDLDDICVSNVNRQLHALDGTFGQLKVEVLEARMRLINPKCRLHSIAEFLTASTLETLLSPKYDFVIDAIDHVGQKCLLIARCREMGIPIVAVGGAGGRRDPTMITTGDLRRTSHDGLLKSVRRQLRREYHFPEEDSPWGVPCVYSKERAVYPTPEGGTCERPPQNKVLRLDCAAGFGAATFVTGSFGFAAASLVVQILAEGPDKKV